MARAKTKRAKRSVAAKAPEAVKRGAPMSHASGSSGASAAAIAKAAGASKPTSTDERRFIELVRNHGEMRHQLTELAMVQDMAALQHHVAAVAGCWFRLGEEHLAEARVCAKVPLARTVYSRSYYAAYSASKAIRYVVKGFASLRGDDHRAVAELPDKFPNVDKWTARLTEMYRHRLFADYDNWRNSAAELSLTPDDTLQSAEEFIRECRKYLKDEYGVTP